MSRKDYVLIARVLKDGNASLELVFKMAEALKTTNPRFDFDRFVNSALAAKSELQSKAA